MKNSDAFIANLLFKLKIYNLSGEAYQEFFSKIMLRHNPLFQEISPYGNLGDGGNDGRIGESNTYFQVYAPKAMSSAAQSDNPAIKTAVSKCSEDFGKLKESWPDIQNYYFVYNDRFSGVPAPVIKELDALREKYKLQDARAFGAESLLDIFKQLNEDDRYELVGFTPDVRDHALIIEPGAIGELLTNLTLNDPIHDFELDGMKLVEYEKKIQLNNLSKSIKVRMDYSLMNVGTIESFFSSNSGSSVVVATNITNIYSSVKAKFPDNEENKSDLIYLALIDDILKDKIYTQNTYTKRAYSLAIEVIIAYYFESCDIYERN